jgi:hypothetical protein
MTGFEVSCCRAKARKADRKSCFPADAVEILEMGSEPEDVVAPVCEPDEGANANAAKSSLVATLGAVDSPIEVLLGPGCVILGVGFSVIGFLVNDEPFAASLDHASVFRSFHGSDFDGESGNGITKRREAFLKVSIGDEFGMFSCNEEDVSKTLIREKASFGDDLGNRESCPENGIISGETAVGAVVNALI